MRNIAWLMMAFATSATPAWAGPMEIPLVAIGLPFSPETPRPVGPTHVLYHDVEVGEIQGLPSAVKSGGLNWIAAAKRSSVNAALRETFTRMNLASVGQPVARKRLVAIWVGDHTPFRIGTGNTSSVTIRYRLERIDNGQALFDRVITTSADGQGGSASQRDNAIVRIAIAANFASAANCIDHAAYAAAPADCALTPRFHISAIRVGR